MRLCRILKIKPVVAVGHLQSLWHFTLRNAWENADLSPWGDDGIDAAARWEGAPGAMVKALREVGYLDGSVVHGWLERAGSLVLDRLRKKSARSENVRKLSGKSPGQSEATLPYPTVPYPTLPTDNNRKDAPAAVDFSDYRLNIGKYKGVYVVNVPADECSFVLATTPRLGAKESAALKWRIALKASEAEGMNKAARI